jgi:hypothetical protein
MRKLLATFAAGALLSGIANIGLAQEGHPVKGSWIGEWQGNTINGESILMVMNWDGKAISGIINPGTDNIQISKASLNPDDWTVHIEAGAYVLDGTFERLELPNRSITGNWHNGNASGSFEIVRQ